MKNILRHWGFKIKVAYIDFHLYNKDIENVFSILFIANWFELKLVEPHKLLIYSNIEGLRISVQRYR